ncbi:MAG: glycoside hydrolase family 88 protein [Planctomycetaceae bacterium]|nr:glycoside hydrolase family 88 protein [Planctomycetaceae bacterium]
MLAFRCRLIAMILTGLVPAAANGETPASEFSKLPLVPLPVGVTLLGTTIPGYLPADDAGVLESPRRLVLVGGIDGDARSSQIVENLAARFFGPDAANWRKRWTLAVVPRVQPDDGPARLLTAFPPPDNSYTSETVPEAQYLWRWLALNGTDVVVEVRAAETAGWHGPGAANPLIKGELAQALNAEDVANVGKIPAWRYDATSDVSLDDFLMQLERLTPTGRSPARRTLQARASRTPLEVARQLEAVYGHKLDPVEYLQGTAVVGRLRLSELTNDAAMRKDVERIAFAWVGKPTLNEKSSGSNFAGHWIFAELARREPNPGYISLVRQVADRGFDASGKPLPAMPTHSEMSDAVFMSTPILVEAGRLTGDAKYYEMAARHLTFMTNLNRRADGLHRHSPLDETAWGRGNGFPALGLAWCLDVIPEDRPERALMLEAFRTHIAAVLPHQDATGMWHQVIDHPESYRELTSTCMMTYALLRGRQQGWLDSSVEPTIERAWEALKLRIGEDGVLFDVCTGTGKQKSLREYYDRTAILGKDARGGAMSLLVSTEYANWKQR